MNISKPGHLRQYGRTLFSIALVALLVLSVGPTFSIGAEKAFIHQQAAGAAAEGRPDITVAELQARIFDGRLVALHRCLEGHSIGAKLFGLILADVIFAGQIGIAPGIYLRLPGQHLVFRQPGLGLTYIF